MKFGLLLILLLTACAKSQDPRDYFERGEYSKAYALWLTEANSGDSEAMNYLGIHHYLGLGMPRDYRKAITWFEKGARAGFADAQYNLGSMYENGEFVDIDYMQAYMWLYAAHKNGNPHAANRMWGITGDHKIFGNQVAMAEDMAEEFIDRSKQTSTTVKSESAP